MLLREILAGAILLPAMDVIADPVSVSSIPCTPHLHPTYIPHISHTHPTYIPHTSHIYPTHIQHTYYIHPTYIPRAYHLYPTYTLLSSVTQQHRCVTDENHQLFIIYNKKFISVEHCTS